MRLYSFAPISAREYPTVETLDHPHIWGGVQFCVNLSEKPYSPDLVSAMAAHGIEWVHCPVSEGPGADWLESFAIALPKMYRACKAGKKQIVHCDLGNNRSRAFAEALFFAVVRKEYDEPYKGADNHLEYNCIQGHLPDIGEVERRIRAMIGMFPNWSMPEEDAQRRLLLQPSPRWTQTSHTINTKANPMVISREELSGTPLQSAVEDSVDDYKAGRPVGPGITVDEVDMTILDDWAIVGAIFNENGPLDAYAPMLSVPGEEPERMQFDWDIHGFTPIRAHEYKLRVRRFYLTNDRLMYHHYELLEIISDTLTQ